MNNALLCSIIATTYHRTFISQNGGLGTVTGAEALRLQRAGLGSIHTVDGGDLDHGACLDWLRVFRAAL